MQGGRLIKNAKIAKDFDDFWGGFKKGFFGTLKLATPIVSMVAPELIPVLGIADKVGDMLGNGMNKRKRGRPRKGNGFEKIPTDAIHQITRNLENEDKKNLNKTSKELHNIVEFADLRSDMERYTDQIRNNNNRTGETNRAIQDAFSFIYNRN